MPVPRRTKNDHLIYADVVDSKSKAGVWMGERVSFHDRQRQILEAVKDKLAWVPVEGGIMAISTEPAGIAVIAPNPTLPGVIVLANGGSPAATAEIQATYEAAIREAMADLGIAEEETA